MKKQGLYKTKGKTNDFRGCEFTYTRYVNRDSAYNIEEIVYVDDVSGYEAKSLNELKIIMSEK